mgnify:CR=1 FL=1
MSNTDISNNYDLVKTPTIWDRKNLICDTHEEIRILQSALQSAKTRLVLFEQDYDFYCKRNKNNEDVKNMKMYEYTNKYSYLFHFLDTLSFGLLSKFY